MRILFAGDLLSYVVHGLLPALEQRSHAVRVIPLRLFPPGSQAEVLREAARECGATVLLSAGCPLGQFDLDSYLSAARSLGLFHLYWGTEDPVFHRECSLAFAPSADHVFTPAEELLPSYKALGKPASLLQFGCNPQVHRKTAPDPRYAHDLVLVAHNYHWPGPAGECRRRAVRAVLLPLIEEGFDVRVFGVDWTTPRVAGDLTIPEANWGGVCHYLETPRLYSSARIVLGIHSSDESATQCSCRTFEALGCGAFYLTYRTPAHERLFENHRHLVWTDSPEETLALVRYYLAHDEERARVAAAGQALVYARDTYAHRARALEEALAPFVREGRPC
ncbi:MAG: glycosyltransferase [Chitinophagales bacterium]